MKGYSSINMNFSEISRTTNGSDRNSKSKMYQHLQGLRDQAILQQKSMRNLKHSLLRSQNNTNTFASDSSWTEGYSKFLDDLDKEEFLRDAPFIECRNRVASSAKSARSRYKGSRRFVSMGIDFSYNFTLKL